MLTGTFFFFYWWKKLLLLLLITVFLPFNPLTIRQYNFWNHFLKKRLSEACKHAIKVRSKVETGGRGATCLHVETLLVIYEHRRRVVWYMRSPAELRQRRCSWTRQRQCDSPLAKPWNEAVTQLYQHHAGVWMVWNYCMSKGKSSGFWLFYSTKESHCCVPSSIEQWWLTLIISVDSSDSFLPTVKPTPYLTIYFSLSFATCSLQWGHGRLTSAQVLNSRKDSVTSEHSPETEVFLTRNVTVWALRTFWIMLHVAVMLHVFECSGFEEELEKWLKVAEACWIKMSLRVADMWL